MNPIKVKHTEAYKDGQIDTIVCKGKLVLIKQKNDIIFPCISSNLVDSDWCILNGLVRSPRNYYKPIIISETENHPNGLGYYSQRTNAIVNSNPTWVPDKFCQVILALPENFSPEQLQAIADRKLKDEVFVECTDKIVCTEGENCPTITGTNIPCNGDLIDFIRIKLNKDNHIKLFSVKKEEGWDWIISKYEIKIDERAYNHLVDNYNPPIRK